MWEPQTDLDAAAALGETLRGLGYDEEAIEERLGEDGVAAEGGEVLVHALAARRTTSSATRSGCCCSHVPVARSSFAAAPRARAARPRDGRGCAARPSRAHRPDGGRVSRVRHVLGRRARPAGLGRELHADRVLARLPDATTPCRPRARHRDGERRACAARRRGTPTKSSRPTSTRARSRSRRSARR